MRKPSKLFVKGSDVTVLSPDRKSRVFSTVSDASLKRSGYHVKRERKYMFEAFAGINGETPYAISSDLDDLKGQETGVL